MRGPGALADTWWGGSEAAGRVGGHDGAKQHAGGGACFLRYPHHGSKATQVLSIAEDTGDATGQVVSPFTKWVFSRKAKAGNTKLAKKSAKHS